MGLEVGLRVWPGTVGLKVLLGERVVGSGVGLPGRGVGLRVGDCDGKEVGEGDGGVKPVTIIVPEHVEFLAHP